MKIRETNQEIINLDVDAYVVGVFEDDHGKLPETFPFNELDNLLDGNLSTCCLEGEMKGNIGEITILHALKPSGPKRIAIVGLGKKKLLSLKTIRRMSAEVIRRLRDINCYRVAFHLLGSSVIEDLTEISWTIVEGCILGHYRFDKYFSQEQFRKINSILIHFKREEDAKAIQEGINFGKIFAEETNFSKNISNEPSNVVTPRKLAEIAKETSEFFGLDLTILDKEKIVAEKMGLIEAVSRGSVEPPFVISMTYKGTSEDKPFIGLVGKGVTFDSGGVSLKKGRGMFAMKRDLTGGAVVIALMKALARLELNINVAAIIPCIENMPSGKAYKPGDIITSMSGKTVEIFNTDAEGRLILADALTYIQKRFQPKLIIDVATLTGAAIHALGPKIVPFFSTNEQLSKKIIQSGELAGESLWELPIYEDYNVRVKSHFADVKNDSDKPPQTIVGALFLKSFLESEIDWIHLDIAALDTSSSEYSYISRGATGVAVRTLLRFLMMMQD